MDAKEFFDAMYQQWSLTTGAKDRYWIVEKSPYYDGYTLYAVDEHDDKQLIALNLKEADADWLASIHGSFGDVIRLSMEAQDEAESLDNQNDENINRIAALELEAHVREQEMERTNTEVAQLRSEKDELLREIRQLEDELSLALGDLG